MKMKITLIVTELGQPGGYWVQNNFLCNIIMKMIDHHILRLSSYLKEWDNIGMLVSIGGNLGGHFRIILTTIGYKK